jgi:hypothetical protein
VFLATGTPRRKRKERSDGLDDPILDKHGIMAVLLEPQDPDEID